MVCLSDSLDEEAGYIHQAMRKKIVSVVLFGVDLVEKPQHPSSNISFGSRARQLDRVIS